MQQGYFKTAWHDIKNSPGWFGKIMILGLVCLIPIFGQMVVMGYLYGWARDIAWGVHAPLPARVFGNEDGKLYSRGFFVCVITFVLGLIPFAIDLLRSVVSGGSLGILANGVNDLSFLPLGFAVGLLGGVLVFLSLAAEIFVMVFTWVGSVRMSIYGRLSAGFQFGKIWAMLRHDVSGMLRILGMALLLCVALAVVLTVFIVIFLITVTVFAIAIQSSNPSSFDSASVGVVFVGISLLILCLVAGAVACMAASTWVNAMIIRAVGYWVQQFNVPAWHGQDDPMPFELANTVG